MYKIGIIGNGYVGKGTEIAMTRTEVVDIVIYDTDPKLCKPEGVTFDDLHECALVFVCVPTPMREDHTCHIDIVESVVHRLVGHGIEPWRIIIRSTVPVGTSAKLGVNFMPEFLTERNWEQDAQTCKDFIVGSDSNSDKLHAQIYKIASEDKKFHAYTTKEAELIKYVRNSYLATKVSFFNEIAELCEAQNISYDSLLGGVTMDKRINESHTQVPGPDGKKGFGGTCFPKDVHSLLKQMEQSGINSYIIQATLKRNENVDRVEQDWRADKGRAVI